jgi:hypothetical protein
MSILTVPQMVLKFILHLEVHNYHIQGTTFLQNTREDEIIYLQANETHTTKISIQDRKESKETHR